MSRLSRRDFKPAQPILAVKKLLDYLDEVAALQDFQATAATATTTPYAFPQGSSGLKALSVGIGDAAAAGESMTFDVQRVRAGAAVSMLTGVATVDDSVAANSVTDFSSLIDPSVTLQDGDLVQVVRTYVAGGGATPLTNTIVKVTPT